MKALDRKVWLPSGGSLVIDRTEAMTVVDVNTGKFVGAGGNLEQTVTRNNIEAAEEIVRQLRLRDVGGIVVIDFIDMVLESNRDLVLRRLTECLGRDRTKHQVAEVTSLGLVQMTRKRVGEGLLEAFSEPCEVCKGRGVLVHTEPVDKGGPAPSRATSSRRRTASSGAARAASRPRRPSRSSRPPRPEQRQAAVGRHRRDPPRRRAREGGGRGGQLASRTCRPRRSRGCSPESDAEAEADAAGPRRARGRPTRPSPRPGQPVDRAARRPKPSGRGRRLSPPPRSRRSRCEQAAPARRRRRAAVRPAGPPDRQRRPA